MELGGLAMTLAPGTKFTYLGEASDDTNYYVVNDHGSVDHFSRGTVTSDVGSVKYYYQPGDARVIEESEEPIRKGDKFTHVPSYDSFYTALEDGPGRIKVLFTSSGGNSFECTANAYGSTIIERAQEGNDTMNPNAAKLELAADYGLQAKFNYTNERGETADRRLKVESYDGEVVGGQSYDFIGYAEGYKNFRLDRINDSVVIR